MIAKLISFWLHKNDFYDRCFEFDLIFYPHKLVQNEEYHLIRWQVLILESKNQVRNW